MGVRRAHLALSVAVVLAAVTAVVRLPAVGARAKALPMLAEAVGVELPRPLAPPVARSETELDGASGHLYRPASGGPSVVVVPGAATRGKDDPRMVRLARAVARSGRTVFVPDLTLAERRFDPDDIDRIVRAALVLSTRDDAPVGLLGISYGGSYALVAAADPRLAGRLAIVAVFGAYFDLRGVIQAVTTGESLVRDRRIPWERPPVGEAVLREQAVDLLPEEDRAEIRAALEGGADPAQLGPGTRAMLDLLDHTDPTRTFDLVAALPAETRSMLARFSPATVARRIEAPVVAMHSTDDSAVPYGELVRLQVGMPRARTVTVEAFRHVDLRASGPSAWLGLGRDVLRAWGFAYWVLEPQE